MTKPQADAQGFILMFPDNQPNNCWDVGTTMSLKHDGGGDTQAVAQIDQVRDQAVQRRPGPHLHPRGVRGRMLVQAMAAVYPDLIRAGSARAGVPADAGRTATAAAINGATPARPAA